MTSTAASASVAHLHDEDLYRLCILKHVHWCHNLELLLIKSEHFMHVMLFSMPLF